MTPQRVTLITLGVTDLAAARAFYGRLGWVEQGANPGVAFFQMHGAVLGLFGRADLAADQGRAGTDLGTGAMTLAQNFASEAEVDAAFAKALAVGGTALKAPEKVFWGGYSGYWADPDGHVWEVAMNPFWPLARDGSLTLPAPVEVMAEWDLTPADTAEIAGLLARCFATDFGGRSFFHQRPHLRLITREQTIIGHMALALRAVRLGGVLVDIAGLAGVATDPDHRGKGIATRLLQAAIIEARQSPAEFMLLFGTANLCAAAGFRRAQNQITFTDLTGAQTGAVKTEAARVLMVLPLRDRAWNDTLPLDLPGHLM